jgi:hypothetical protein
LRDSFSVPERRGEHAEYAVIDELITSMSIQARSSAAIPAAPADRGVDTG